MRRNRGAAIIIQDGKIALIKRVREGEVYFVFPGGGIEEGETPEEATKREVYPALTGSKTPPQNSVGAKELGGRSTARKRPIGSTNNQWGMNKTPTD